MNNRHSYFVPIAVLTSLILWASSFAAIEIGLKSYTPGHLALLRFATATVGLLIYALVTRMPLPARQDIPAFALLGFIGFTVYHIAQNSGQQSVSAGAASFINAAAPIFTALLAVTFLRERLNKWGWLGIGISFVGVVLVSINTEGGLYFEPGAVLILGSAMASSLYFVLQKPFLAKYTGLQLTTYTMLAGTLFLLVYLPGIIEEIQTASLDATLTVGYLGIFPTALAYVLWSYALSRASVSTVTSGLNLLPVITLVIAWLWIGEIPQALAIVGGVLTLAGVILLNSRGKLSPTPLSEVSHPVRVPLQTPLQERS